MDRLEHRRAPRMQVARRGKPEAALQLRAEIGDDVAEHVVGDDHLELRRVLHQLHRERVDVEMRGGDARILRRELPEQALPERVALRHGVALVRHADLGEAVRPRVIEGVLDDAMHALEGIDLLLDRDLVVGACLEAAADVHVCAFGVLAEDDEIDVGGPAVFQRTEPLVQQPNRPIVDIEIELEARAEQDVARVTHVGDARIAERADVDRGEVVAQRRVAVRRQADAGLQIVVGAVRQHLEIDGPAENFARGAKHFHGFGGHVNANSVTCDDSYTHSVIWLSGYPVISWRQ